MEMAKLAERKAKLVRNVRGHVLGIPSSCTGMQIRITTKNYVASDRFACADIPTTQSLFGTLARQHFRVLTYVRTDYYYRTPPRTAGSILEFPQSQWLADKCRLRAADASPDKSVEFFLTFSHGKNSVHFATEFYISYMMVGNLLFE